MSDLWTHHWRIIIVGVVLGQFFLYAARTPMQQLIRAFGAALKGPFKIAARWCQKSAADLERRNRALLMEASQGEVEKKLERELVRLEHGFAKELRTYPTLHRRLSDAIGEIENDVAQSADAPPSLPGWPEAMRAVSEMPKLADGQGRSILEAMKNAAQKSEERSLKIYRTATSKRHQILSSMLPRVRELKTTGTDLLKAVERALETSTKVDRYMDRFEALARKEGPRVLSFDLFGRFLVALLITTVAASGVFVNFQLIALPMSELVPSGARIASVPVSTFAAVVLVTMEMTAGVFMFDALGITELIPKIGRLGSGQRRMIFFVALTGLLVLSSIEASLAVLREHIAESEVALRAAMAGQTTSAAGWSEVTVIGQAVLGFVLPWILGLIAMPLEMLIQTVRPLLTGLLALGLRAIGLVLRGIAHVIRYSTRAVLALLDVYVVLPEQLMRLFKGSGQPARSPQPAHSVREKVRT